MRMYVFTENIYVTIARRFISDVCMLVSLQAYCRSNLYNKIPFTAVLINVRIENKKAGAHVQEVTATGTVDKIFKVVFFHGKSLQIERKHYYEFDVNPLTLFSAHLQNL
jgi:hypothetical protein